MSEARMSRVQSVILAVLVPAVLVGIVGPGDVDRRLSLIHI